MIIVQNSIIRYSYKIDRLAIPQTDKQNQGQTDRDGECTLRFVDTGGVRFCVTPNRNKPNLT